MNIVAEMITRCNVFFIKWTNGRLGSQLGKYSILLLHTVGRKTGRPHVVPLAYCRDGKNYLLTASNWGREKPPDWYLNLMQHPRTAVQVEIDTIVVETRLASEEEYPRLWDLVADQISFYPRYQKKMSRRIPILVLTPVEISTPDKK
ncbi:MAG: nitroreductase/quinone reductase family protein [Anaerolineaceae bacterium]